MNYSTAIFLINSDVRAVAVSYETDHEGKGKRPFTTFKTFEDDIVEGDYVVIPTGTRHDMTVARVEEVDVEIDLESSAQMHWIVDRVDTTARNKVEAQEAEAIAKIKSAEKRAKQDQLREKLLADNPDLAGLSIVNATASALPAE
ncbi:hypothetical protein D3C72_828710 [compost metagenome]